MQTMFGWIPGFSLILALFDKLRTRISDDRMAAESIRREREILRRWSRRKLEDRFSL